MWQRFLRVRAGTRTAVGGVAGVIAFGIAIALLPWQAALMVSWDTTAAIVVTWVFGLVWRKDSSETAALALREDDSRTASELVLVSASLASLVSVGLGLIKAAQEQGAAKAAMTGAAVLTVVLSWLAVHAVFTLRYARLYYGDRPGGISFNEDDQPDYRDFAYLAFTIGMTYQVSDTNLSTKEIRRTVTRHGLLSYVFGTVIVAMMINVVAGLLK
jgi:uncharacterized membrane protein